MSDSELIVPADGSPDIIYRMNCLDRLKCKFRSLYIQLASREVSAMISRSGVFSGRASE